MLHSTNKGDLIRVGFVPDIDKDYRKKFDLKAFPPFETILKHKKKKYDVLVVGDSFSRYQGRVYCGVLEQNSLSVLNIELRSWYKDNPIKTLLDLSKGDFFDNYTFDYVILESVERDITHRVNKIQKNDTLMLSDINDFIEYSINSPKKFHHNKSKFFSVLTLKYPLYIAPKRIFCDESYISGVYSARSNTNELFSNHTNKILFLDIDVERTPMNNDKNRVSELNDVVNSIALNLREKGMELIFLPAPDRFDFYYDEIKDKTNFPKPYFFDLMEKENKNYIYINTKQVLRQHIHSKQDIYFYDDTHWSPVGALIIGDTLVNIIKK